MKTEDKGVFLIEYDKENKPVVIFKPVNGTVWLNKAELAELLGVFVQSINSYIKELYYGKVFEYEGTCIYHLYTSRNAIKYEATEFNLQVIIALVFHIYSWQAKLIREWVIRKVIIGHFIVNSPLSEKNGNYYLN
jgi:hypothetical protein